MIVAITGASRGIGRAIAERCVADGHHVLIGYRSDRAAAERVRDALRVAGGL